jgi:hypothetical protein
MRFRDLRKHMRISPAIERRPAMIRDYVQRKELPLDQNMIVPMGAALRAAGVREAGYGALPETVRNGCLDLCFALDEQGDSRLIRILMMRRKRKSVSAASSLDRVNGIPTATRTLDVLHWGAFRVRGAEPAGSARTFPEKKACGPRQTVPRAFPRYF